MDCMSLLGFGACAPDAEFRARLPLPVSDIARDAIPPMLRRRSSQTSLLAFSAAELACAQAGRSPARLAAVFASVAGEIQTTDQLCVELSKPDGAVSPSAFHNSVQNTVAGYWSIAQQCTQAATALAAGHDTFAMALLEAWSQLACQGGELLLVCYDERWPDYLLPGCGQTAFASAMVLAAGPLENSIAQIGRPHVGTALFPSAWRPQARSMPILASLPFLERAAVGGKSALCALSTLSPGWQLEIHPAHCRPTP